MERHPLYERISADIEAYPAFGAALFAVYADLTEVQKWQNVKIEHFTSLSRCIISRSKQAGSEIVVPCLLEERWSMKMFKTLFENLDGTPTATLGILSPDSTVVYYKIHRGIVKPKEVDSDEDDEPKETDD